MSSQETPNGDLEAQARDFAKALSTMIAKVFGPTSPQFIAEISEPKVENSTPHILVKPQAESQIELKIDGHHALNLVVQYQCTWDHRGHFLKVQRANFHVFPADNGEALFRYEFVANPNSSNVPAAHFQVHAHRDELLYTLLRSNSPKNAGRMAALRGGRTKIPKLASIHFPMGGPRMRPALEDVLQLLTTEFNVESEANALKAIQESRAQWRRDQIAACIRDAPEVAATALERLGYTVTRPAELGPVKEQTDKLSTY